MGALDGMIESAGPKVILTGVMLTFGMAVLWLFIRHGGKAIKTVAERTSDKRAVEREQRARTLWLSIRRLFVLLWSLGGALTLLAIWDIPITGLLAVGSVVAVALGLGAQNLVQDIIGGFFIVVEDQYGIGDTVDIAGVGGTVEEIGLRSTVLRDLNGRVHYVPNGQVKVATNYTHDHSQIVIDVGVAYDTDIDRALGILADELAGMAADSTWSRIILDRPQVLGVNQLADSAVELRSVIRTLPDDRWRVRRAALRRIKLRFDAEGISIPHPHIHVKMDQDLA